MQEKVQETINTLLDAFKSGHINTAVCRTVIQHQNGDKKPSDNWSALNRIVMFLHDTDDARTFLQWKAAERNIIKGAKAFNILAPCTKKIKTKEADANGQEQEVVHTIITGFKPLPVFRLENTDGKDIPVVDYAPPVLPPLVAVAENLGLTVEYKPFGGREYGYYSPLENKIVLKTYDFSTLAHELSHAAHNSISHLKGGQDADQEILAQFCAEVLCRLYGEEDRYTGYTYRYISNYAQENKPEKVVARIASLLTEAEQVLKIILPVAEQSQVA